MENQWINHPTTLHGKLVILVPLELNELDALHEAANDKRIWEFYPGDWSQPKRFREVYTNVISQRQQGQAYPFIIKRISDGQILGSTRLMDLEPHNNSLEIGGTWLISECWGTAINFDCKLLLLSHAFEVLNAHRVYLKTQHNNIRSRKAIEKIGASFEGVVREHMLKDDGSYRSSAYFSILAHEWPEKKVVLEKLIEDKFRGD